MNLSDQDSTVSVDTNIKKFFPKSFYYFKLGILFHILCLIKNINTKEKQKELFNNIEEFKESKYIYEKITEYIFKNKNPLVYTFYNQLPNIFLPIPSELIYYRPYITFFKNNKTSTINLSNKFSLIDIMKNYIINNHIKIDEKNIDRSIFKSIQPLSEFPTINSLFIPIDDNFYNLLKQISKDRTDLIYIMYYDNNCYAAHYNHDTKTFNLLYKKEKTYVKINRDISIDIAKLTYISIMYPLSRENIFECFDTDILPKDSLLYHNTKNEFSNDFLNKKSIFLSLYRDINLADPYSDTINRSYNCYTFKAINDLKVLNLNKDSFYDQLFDKKDNEEEFIYKDTRDNSKIIKSKLFQCIGDNLVNRKQCNIAVKTTERSQGKRMLALLINKNVLFWLGDDFYYMNFLKHYNIDTFIYHIGFYKNKQYQSELGITNNLEKYVKYIDYHKDVCNIDML